MAVKPVVNEYRSSESMYSLASFVNFINANFVVFFLAILFFLGGFYAGSLWSENRFLKAGGLPTAGTGAAGADAGVAAAPEGPTPETLKKAPKVTNDDRIRGNKNAEITLIEYSDFECPFCAQFHPTMQQVMKEYGDKVRWVYRHFPLSFHPNAQKAAEASECVAKQKGNDGFWAYGDKLFEENNKLGGRLTTETITSSAQAVGVNMDAFQKCLDSGEMAAKVKAQMDGGTAAGISGTPGTIIMVGDQAELIPGALPFDQVKVALDKYVK